MLYDLLAEITVCPLVVSALLSSAKWPVSRENEMGQLFFFLGGFEKKRGAKPKRLTPTNEVTGNTQTESKSQKL